MILVPPAPGTIPEEGDDSPTPRHPEVANDVSETGPQARAPGTEEPPSFDLLYEIARAHLPDALRHWRVPPADVDDIIQDAALIARDALPRFIPRGGPTPDLRRSLRAWLSAIGWRLASRRRRRAYRRFELPQGDPADLGAEDPETTEELAAENQRRAILDRLVRTLRPERAQVLLMHTLLGMTVPEIAEALNVNANTVKSRLARARADALVAVDQLDPDEQSLLRGSLLILPLLYVVDVRGNGATNPAPAGNDATPERLASRSRLLRGALLAAGAAAMLAIGVAIGASMRGPARHAAEEAAVVAAVDRSEPEDTTPVQAVSAPAEVPAQPLPATGSAGTDTKGRSLAREQKWLAMVRHALLNHDAEHAQAALNAHAAEFPHGVLASQREGLRAEVRALATER